MSGQILTRPSLAAGSVNQVSSTIFSLASTAPTYSLAVTAGLLASLVGGWSPLLLAASALPIALVVLCFGELNNADPDCGTTYAWTSKAFGRRAGWLTGWFAIAACVLVMSNLIQTAALYAFTVVGADGLADSKVAQAGLGVGLLVLMAWLADLGITVAARVQVTLFAAEVIGLAYFAVGALLADPLPHVGASPEISAAGIASAFLAAVFLYWGWDSSFSVNEESAEPRRTPVRAAMLAMAGLVVLYAGFCWAVTSYAGAGRLAEIGEDDLFAELGTQLLGSTGGTLLAGAVLFSALASAQTTILPSARSAFSMARRGDLPVPLAQVSSTGSPSYATWTFTALSGLVYVVLILGSENVLWDSIAATAVLVAAYYGATCLAVPFYFGRTAAERPLQRLVVPAVATATFAAVLVMSLRDSSRITLTTVFVVAATGLVYALFNPSLRRSPR